MHRTSLLQWQGYRTFEAFHKPILARHHITPIEWMLLGIIHDEGDLRVTEIADRLDVHIPFVTRTIKILLQKKNIIIEQHPRDKRVKCVGITAEGKRRLFLLEKDVNKTFRLLLQRVPAKKIEAYKEVLAVLIRNGKILSTKLG